ncbi:dnaJ protein 2 [Artemisia annua]|uniref:DnaJ protein 2 n=1 Tax=Artemisia annua TaxID=35608 RepID=A0A2U1PXZ5_ARTAN|nr:dnaJ protein 2 [Artemisia annua]
MSFGESINEKDRCQPCKGKEVTQEKKVLEVHVEKRMQHGQKITFEGQADEAPDTVRGDIIFLISSRSILHVTVMKCIYCLEDPVLRSSSFWSSFVEQA